MRVGRSAGGFGPGFQSAGSRLYRAEYAAATVAVVGFLGYMATNSTGLALGATALWFLFPDVAAFVPIGLSRERRSWPRWGSYLYNFFHTVLVWGLCFAALWLVFGSPYWPSLGWLVHITADRAAGFGLRDRARAKYTLH
jgi:hypothetical protein